MLTKLELRSCPHIFCHLAAEMGVAVLTANKPAVHSFYKSWQGRKDDLAKKTTKSSVKALCVLFLISSLGCSELKLIIEPTG